MAFESDKIMFEIYKDILYNQKYRVVYYTELNENNKHAEITRAMSGNSYYDGFIKDYRKEDAKKIIGEIVAGLNEGNEISKEEIKQKLKEFTP
jgi:thiaminase